MNIDTLIRCGSIQGTSVNNIRNDQHYPVPTWLGHGLVTLQVR